MWISSFVYPIANAACKFLYHKQQIYHLKKKKKNKKSNVADPIYFSFSYPKSNLNFSKKKQGFSTQNIMREKPLLFIPHYSLFNCDGFFSTLYFLLKSLLLSKVVEFLVHILNGTNHSAIRPVGAQRWTDWRIGNMS